MFRFVFLILFLFSGSLYGESLVVKPGDQLLVRGKRGHLHFKRLLSNKKKEKILTVDLVNGSGGKQSLDDYCRLSRKSSILLLNCGSNLGFLGGLILKFSGASVPLTVNWEEGKHIFEDWDSDISLYQNSGKVLIRRGKGQLKLGQLNGKVEVDSYKGGLKAQFYSVNFRADGFQGNIFVDNFSGSTKIVKTSGELGLKGFSGKAFVENSSGVLNFEHRRTSLRIEGFEGQMKGVSGQGSVIGQKLKVSSVRIKTKEGSVRLSKVRGRANLGTVRGHIVAPPGLKFTQLSNLKLMVGSFSGRLSSTTRGYIYVRTESGNIKLR